MNEPCEKDIKRVALTDIFTLVVGKRLDYVALADAVKESRTNIRLWDPRVPSRGDSSVDPKRLNVRLDGLGVITRLHYG
ncbi:MAG: hypothetical protein HY370_03740 [Proteobacteria bacterium]|nr:hypothetical protein [Pseudomonadota bacterium]